MDKIKNVSIKRSMTLTFIITICIIGVLSGITIFIANQSQQKILRNKYLMVRSPDYELDKSTNVYTINMDGSVVEWHGLSMAENIAYHGCYFAMTCLPVLYIIVGIGSAAAIYYRVKLKVPILQLQKGMKRIQDNDLDFSIEYSSDDELGKLCRSMEKMRTELCHNNKALWETLRQRKLLNASVAHDLRTPITVLRGYIDFLSHISLTSVNIDKSVLFRVLENLLQNAMRYMNEQIIVEVNQKDNLFLLSVKDDGKGFSEEDLRQATNMFYGKEKGNEHFGIGLGVCRLLCEKHGGFFQIGNNEISGAYVIAALDISE